MRTALLALSRNPGNVLLRVSVPSAKALRALSVPQNRAVPQHDKAYRWRACGRAASWQVA